MAKASVIVSVAREYKNYQEKRKLGTKEQMWDFHWAPGSANYTIWAILYHEWGGGNYQGQPWCAVYVSDVFSLAYGIKEAIRLLGGGVYYNCQSFVNLHKKDKRLNHVPGIGCPVFFWTGAKYGHTGICTGVDSNGNGFTSIEGNTSGGADKVDPDGGAVVEKWHSLDGRTLFWHPDFDPESAPDPVRYDVSCGRCGLEVTAYSLSIRNAPGETGVPAAGFYQKGDHVQICQKCFIDGKPWYRTDRGWISASYVQGWVLEGNGRWWYVMPGYSFTVNGWQDIDGVRYWFDNTGYMTASAWIQTDGDYYLTSSGMMARNAYVKSVDKELYYWVGEDGRWQPEWDTVSPDLDRYQLVK